MLLSSSRLVTTTTKNSVVTTVVTSFIIVLFVVCVVDVVTALDDAPVGSGNNGGNNSVNRPFGGVGRNKNDNNNNDVQHHIPDTHYDVRILDDDTYPVFRYFPWKHLKDTQLIAAKSLGYTKETWNNVGTALIETKTYNELNKREKRAIQDLGFHSTSTTNNNNNDSEDNNNNNIDDIWDCYSNHYSKYTWKELEISKVQYYFRLLGFTEANWIYNGNDEDDDSEDGLQLISWEMDWSTLNPVEMNAAKQLCYQQETWDNINLNNWHCTHDHYNDLLWNELKDIGVQDYLITLGFTEDTWCDNEQSQQQQPYDWTTKLWDELTVEEKNAAIHLCYYKDSWNGPAVSSYPVMRFRPWSTLADNMKEVATRDLNYNEKKWNWVGSAAIEHKTYEDLNDQQQQAVHILDMDDDSWNCWLNHYSGFSWFELENRFSIQTDFITLGWTKDDWETKDKSIPTNVPTIEKKWNELTSEEKNAALDLCFVPQNWDMLSLESWHCNEINCFCHYDNYYWDELNIEGVQTYFEILGWSQYTWDGWNNNDNGNGNNGNGNDDYYDGNSIGNNKGGAKTNSQYPETYLIWWDDLTDDQRSAATKVCYTMDSWDRHVHNYAKYNNNSSSNNIIGLFVGILIFLILIGLGGFVGYRLFYKTKLSMNHNNNVSSSNNLSSSSSSPSFSDYDDNNNKNNYNYNDDDDVVEDYTDDVVIDYTDDDVVTQPKIEKGELA